MNLFILAARVATIVSVSTALATASLFERTTHQDTVENCTNIDVDLSSVLNDILHTQLPPLGGNETICLCTTGIPAFISTHIIAQIAEDLVGTKKVTKALTKLIDRNSPKKCNLPSNASPNCVKNDLCAFSCNYPYTLSFDGRSCQKRSGPSQRANKKRSVVETPPQICPKGHKLCPIWEWDSNSAILAQLHHQTPSKSSPVIIPPSMECVDVQNDLFSCGGCTTDLSADMSGTDCAAIPGVSSVHCREGVCDVGSCLRGWKVSSDGVSCERAG